MTRIIKCVSANKSIYRLVIFLDGVSNPLTTKWYSIHQQIYKPLIETKNYSTINLSNDELQQYGELREWKK